MANILEMVKYNADGLIPAVTQDIRTDEVLMVAYMNKESLEKTIETGLAHYYSRSRRKLWLKGETSGHYQKVRSISIDCDGDTLLLKVEQTGAACHTGHRSCFFTRFDVNELKAGTTAGNINEIMAASTFGNISELKTGTTVVDINEFKAGAADNTGGGVSGNTAAAVNSAGVCADAAKAADAVDDVNGPYAVCDAKKPAAACDEGKPDEFDQIPGPEVLGEVFGTILDRLAHPKEGSYTNYLFTKGLDKILKKIGEEASEVVIASKNGSAEEIRAEVADLFYHIMVLLAQQGMSLNDIYIELKKRA